MVRMPPDPAADLVDGWQFVGVILSEADLNLVAIDLAAVVHDPERPGYDDATVLDSNVQRRVTGT